MKLLDIKYNYDELKKLFSGVQCVHNIHVQDLTDDGNNMCVLNVDAIWAPMFTSRLKSQFTVFTLLLNAHFVYTINRHHTIILYVCLWLSSDRAKVLIHTYYFVG